MSKRIFIAQSPTDKDTQTIVTIGGDKSGTIIKTKDTATVIRKPTL